MHIAWTWQSDRWLFTLFWDIYRVCFSFVCWFCSCVFDSFFLLVLRPVIHMPQAGRQENVSCTKWFSLAFRFPYNNRFEAEFFCTHFNPMMRSCSVTIDNSSRRCYSSFFAFWILFDMSSLLANVSSMLWSIIILKLAKGEKVRHKKVAKYWREPSSTANNTQIDD